MKKIIFSFLAIVMVVCFSNKVMAQTDVTDTKSNDANAQILGAIALTVGDPLEFGGIVPGTGGTVIITTGGVRSFTGNATGVSVSTTPTAASYTVAGTGLVPYTITIPASIVIANTTTIGETMTVNNILCSDGLSHIFLPDGTDAFTVGGTLTVASAQEPGLYTGTFDVTVAY